MSVPNHLPVFERALQALTPDDPIEMLQTHISVVGLTVHHAFKMKKPVRFGFVDFSTLNKREASCDDELKLNRRYSQHVYLEKIALRRRADGACKFSNLPADGEVLDWVIKMRRLPEDLTVENLIRHNKWTSVYQQRLFSSLDLVVKGDSPIVLTPDSFRRELTSLVSDSQRELRQLVQAYDRDIVDSLHESLHRFITLHGELWQQRVCDGRVVHGHGDLRPCHIYLTSVPAIIDCVEFSRDLRTLDLLDEFCFLLMELDRLSAAQLADQVLSWYRTTSGDKASDALVAFYKCYRAVVRWKIELLQAGSAGRDYLRLAERYREQLDPRRLIVVGGLSGSGKTVVTTALAEKLHARALHTDKVRHADEDRGGAHIPATEERAFAQGQYSTARRAETYQRMFDRAAEEFEVHRCIILDGTFARREHRETAEKLAAEFAAQQLSVWCTCPDSVRQARVEERLAGMSDASQIQPNHLRQQAEEAEVPTGSCLKLDTTASLPDQLDLICRNLSEKGGPAAVAGSEGTWSGSQSDNGDRRNPSGPRESYEVQTPSARR